MSARTNELMLRFSVAIGFPPDQDPAAAEDYVRPEVEQMYEPIAVYVESIHQREFVKEWVLVTAEN